MLETTINRILNLNPHYLRYLPEIAGLAVAIELSDLPIKITLRAHHSFIEIKSGLHEADLHLTGSSVDFLRFANQKDQRQKLLQANKVQFQGDLAVLQRLEPFLNHFTIPSFILSPFLQLKRFAGNQVEYWQEEQQLLASPILFDYFKDELLDLQQETARLDARLQVLEGHGSPKQ